MFSLDLMLMVWTEAFGLPDSPTDEGIGVEEYPREVFCYYQLSRALYRVVWPGVSMTGIQIVIRSLYLYH